MKHHHLLLGFSLSLFACVDDATIPGARAPSAGGDNGAGSEAVAEVARPAASSTVPSTPSDGAAKVDFTYRSPTGSVAGRREGGQYSDSTGAVTGRVENGRYYDKSGAVSGSVDTHGQFSDPTGQAVGRIEPNGSVHDRTGRSVGRVEGDGTIRDATGAVVGRIEGNCSEECKRDGARKLLEIGH